MTTGAMPRVAAARTGEAFVGLRRRGSASVLVFLVALATRLAVPLLGGGLHGHYRYDAPLYYSAGMALLHGQMPYRDFVLVHPPVIASVTMPFAALGAMTTDHAGFVAANLAFTTLGALNAVLVLRVARSLGLGRGAAMAGALFYAVWGGAVIAEFSVRLEPLGNTLLLLSLLALLTGLRQDDARWLVFAGALLGLAVNVKIWWAVPALVVVGWALAHGARRAAAVITGGGLVVVLLDLPMLLLSKGNMWTMAVTAQLDRPAEAGSASYRFWALSGSRHLDSSPMWMAVGAAVLVALVGLCVIAWWQPRCRLVLLLAGAQSVMLALGPSWNSRYYPGYVAVPLSLALAAGLARLQTHLRGRRLGARLAVVVVGGSLLLTLARLSSATDLVEPDADQDQLRAAVAGAPCVMSNSPMALIAADALHQTFAPGCRNWVDVRGMEGETNLLGSRLVDPSVRPGLVNYLTAAGAVAVVEEPHSSFDRVSQAQLWANFQFVRIGRYFVLTDPARSGERSDAEAGPQPNR